MAASEKITAAFAKIRKLPFLTTVGNLPVIKKLRDLPFISKLSRKAIWGIAIVLVLSLVGGIAYYQTVYLPNQTADQPTMQTAVVRQGDLLIYASGTGTLISAGETDLAFKTGGQVNEILVEVGDKVEVGDVLAQVDDTSAQVAYTQANRTLLELTSAGAIATAQQTIAEATTSLVDARSHLAYIISPNVLYWEEEIVEAEKAVEMAQAASDKSPSDEETQKALDKARAYLEHAQASLVGAQASYIKNYVPNTFTVSNRQTGKYVAAPTEAEILEARAEVKIAQATLTEAEYLYAALTGGEVPEDATGSGLSELEQAKLDLEAAQADLDGTNIVAPISGTVMSIDTSIGDTVSSGATVITIADLTKPSLEVFLDESDWSNVAVDHEVEVTFDILPDRIYTGKVIQVDPGLYTESGSSVVRAIVQLTNIDEGGFNLPLGTSAGVDVIGGRAEDAILVPVEALHEADGQYTVFVVENGKPKLRVVEVGIQDLIYAEILSGLEPGDLVTTGIAETE